MPNKITYTAVAANTSKAIEYWNPYTQQYQDANPLTGIPAGSYAGLKARLKGSNPAIIATFAGTVTVTDEGVAPSPVAMVVFINGQSNAQGNAEADESQYAPMDTLSPNVTQEVTGVHIFNVATQKFETLKVGTNTRSIPGNTYPQGVTYKIGDNGVWPDASKPYDITGVGPEYGLARAAQAAGVTLYIIKYCQGGTYITEWQKGQALYNEFLANKNAALAALATSGVSYKIVGFFRNQGEADRIRDTQEYAAQLSQLYASLTSDGFITSDTKIIEAGTPLTGDTGIYLPNPQNAVKQQFIAQNPAQRFYIDPDFVALEHDRIHWNLASQYKVGRVNIANILFGTSFTLPANVTPAAPTLNYDAATDLVTITPATSAWKMREFFYQLGNAAPMQLLNSWSFSLAGQSYATGQAKAYSRAVPGRNQSPAVSNAVTWQKSGTAPGFDGYTFVTSQGRNTSYDSSLRRIMVTGGTSSQWDNGAPMGGKITIPAGANGLQATLELPDPTNVPAGFTIGIRLSNTLGAAGTDCRDWLLAEYFDTGGTFTYIIGRNASAGITPRATKIQVYPDRVDWTEADGVSVLRSEPHTATTLYAWFMGVTAQSPTGGDGSQFIAARLAGPAVVAL